MTHPLFKICNILVWKYIVEDLGFHKIILTHPHQFFFFIFLTLPPVVSIPRGKALVTCLNIKKNEKKKKKIASKPKSDWKKMWWNFCYINVFLEKNLTIFPSKKKREYVVQYSVFIFIFGIYVIFRTRYLAWLYPILCMDEKWSISILFMDGK